MNIAKYCKSKNMTKDEYKTFKSNITSTAQAIRSSLNYAGGMYFNVSELFNWNSDNDIKCMIINELKKLDVEFFDNDKLYRVCS